MKEIYLKKKSLAVLVLFALTLILLQAPFSIVEGPVNTSHVISQQILREVNVSLIDEHIRFFSNLGSRQTGYVGNLIARDYIMESFKNYSLVGATDGTGNPYLDNFTIAVPLSLGANVTTISGAPEETYTVYPLQPNIAIPPKTPPEGITAHLIDGKTGEYRYFNGKDVSGSIVLMDYASEDNWKNALELGARAVIFVLGEAMPRTEAELKVMELPINIPRVAISSDDGEKLRKSLEEAEKRQENLIVNLKCQVVWRNVETSNIIGFVQGTEYANEIIVIGAYYDSGNILLNYTKDEGAQEAVGISSLLEYARVFSVPENRPKRSLMFVAFAGHHQGLAGSRHFVHKFFFTSPYADTFKDNYLIAFSLNFYTDTSILGAFWAGNFYHREDSREFTYRPVSEISPVYTNLKGFLDDVKQSGLLDGTYIDNLKPYFVQFDSDATWVRYLPGYAEFDAETFFVPGAIELAFSTVFASVAYVKTPFDTYQTVKLYNLEPQVKLVGYFISATVNMEPKKINWSNNIQRQTTWRGWAELNGIFKIYNESKGDYEEKGISDSVIFIGDQYHPNHYFVVLSDEEGRFNVTGLKLAWSHDYYVLGFKINKTTGNVEYAPDVGRWGSRFPPFASVNQAVYGTPQTPVWFVGFECGTILVHDINNPRNLKSYTPLPWLEVLLVERQNPPNKYFPYFDNEERVAIFASPNEAVWLRVAVGGESYPVALLLNATEENPMGSGYAVETGELVNVEMTSYQFAKDYYYLNKRRLQVALEHMAFSQRAVYYYNNSGELLKQAEGNLTIKEYEKAKELSLASFATGQKAYSEIRTLYYDVINVTSFFFALLIPFAFLAERLVFMAKSGIKRVIGLGLMFAIPILFLYFFHPGFHLAFNIFIVLIALVITVLTLPVFSVIFGDFLKEISELRKKKIARHEAEISRISAVIMALSTGIANLRRRKLRTALTLTTVVVTAFAIIAFTTTSTSVAMRVPIQERITPYNGFLMEDPSGEKVISDEMLTYVEARFSTIGVVSPRSWILPADPHFPVDLPTFLITNESDPAPPIPTQQIRAFMGFTVQEANITGIDKKILIPGKGSWFDSDMEYSCIIPTQIADYLGADVGEEILFHGIPLTVRGIFNSSEFIRLTDISGALVVPRLGPTQEPLHGAGIVIVPYQLSRHVLSIFHPVQVPQILVKLHEIPNMEQQIRETAEEIKLAYPDLDIYGSFENKVFAFMARAGFVIVGWEFVMVPLFIGAFTIINTLVAGVYERVKDIKTYSSVGLSPLHVAFMFLAESLVYGVISAVVGYVAGITTVNILYNLGYFPPGFYPNFSSKFVIIAIGVSIVVTLLPTTYPMYKASKIVTPSLERVWKIPTTPKRGKWHIPLPFTTTTDREAQGLQYFLYEFLEQHSTRDAGVFTASEIKYEEKETPTGRYKTLMFKGSVEPWEASITQNVQINAVKPEKVERWGMELFIERLTGHERIWKKATKNFVDSIRKQMLIWRALKLEQKQEFQSKAPSELGKIREER